MAHVLGRAVERADRRHVARHRRALDPPRELGGDHVLVAASGDGSPDELLVRHRAVELRGVEEVDAQLEPVLDRRHALVLVGRAVEGRHPHAAEPDRRHLEVSDLAVLHVALPRFEVRLWSSPR